MKHRAQRGASLPETVIVMSVLLALIFGIIDFGRCLYTYSFVAQLARQGARWVIVRGADCSVLDHCMASVTGNPNDLQTYVRSLSEGATVPGNTSVSGAFPPGACTATHAPGCVITVTVSYPFKFILPLLSSLNWTIQSTSTMVVSQ